MYLVNENRGVARSAHLRSRRFMVMMAAFSVVFVIFVVVMMATTTPKADAAKQCNNAHTQILKIGIKKARTAFYCLLNEERKVAGLGAVESDSRIELAAQRHSQDMVEREYFSHTAPPPAPYGKEPVDRVVAAGWSEGGGVSEAIGGGPTPHWVLSSWLASKGHCQLIMASTQDYAGLGWYKGTGTLNMVGKSYSSFPACPRKMRTNAAPFVKMKAIRNGKRLLVRLKTNMSQRVIVEIGQPWRSSRYEPIKKLRVRLNGKPRLLRVRLKRATKGYVSVGRIGYASFR